MTQNVLREKLKEIRENCFFTIMADEYTGISNKEQLSFCVRSVSDDLKVHELKVLQTICKEADVTTFDV